MTGWLPIESAPRDGTWVLLAGGEIDSAWDGGSSPTVVVGQFLPHWENSTSWQFAWYDSGYYGEYESPTHWQPLPDPPT